MTFYSLYPLAAHIKSVILSSHLETIVSDNVELLLPTEKERKFANFLDKV